MVKFEYVVDKTCAMFKQL